MDISIVLLCRNRLEQLQKIVPLIRSQQTPYSFEIIAVDSGSTPEAIDYLKSNTDIYTWVPVVPRWQFNFAHALNTALSL
jgi:glycosyltransferase involved in cell wall biosynthesis